MYKQMTTNQGLWPMQSARTSRRPRPVHTVGLFHLAVAAVLFSAISQAPAQDGYTPITGAVPKDLQWSNPLQGQTVKQPAGQQAPNPVQAPADVIYNVQGATTNPSTPVQLNKNLSDIVTMSAPTSPSTANSTTLGPNSVPAPLYATPNNQTFNNDGNNVTKMPGSALAIPSTTAASAPAVKAAAPSMNLADFGVTQQDVTKVRTASTSIIALPTNTDVWNAAGKPINFVSPPAIINAAVANSTPRYAPRRQPGSYANQTDGSAEFAQALGLFLLGVAEGYASSGGGFGGGGGYRGGGGGRVGGPCSYWTTNVAACRAVR